MVNSYKNVCFPALSALAGRLADRGEEILRFALFLRLIERAVSNGIKIFEGHRRSSEAYCADTERR